MLLLLPILLVVLIAILLQVGLWGSHGNFPALLAGHVMPWPKHLSREIQPPGRNEASYLCHRAPLSYAFVLFPPR